MMSPCFSPDKMLQGRLFSYNDTHRHRLGANWDQIPVNCPYRAKPRYRAVYVEIVCLREN